MSGGALRVALVTVGDPHQMSGGFLYHQRVAERAGDHNVEVHFVSMPVRRFPLSVVDGRTVLQAVADSDVVVVDSLASNTLGPWLAAGRCPRPLVGSVHQGLGGIDTGPVRRVVQRWSDRWAWLAASRLIVASESLALELAAAGIPADGMCVAPSGRDGVADSEGPWPDLRHGRAIAVLTVANWLDRKGITDVLEAVASVPSGAVTLHLAGDEDVDPRYRRRVLRRLARPDLAGRVVRHGIVPPARMGDLYQAADVLALGSTVEPYGAVYGEAMAHGLPVVGWSAGNLPHLVDDGVEGFLVPVGQVEVLQRRLTALAEDPQLRSRLGTAALDRAEKLPTWDDTAERFYATCRAALRSHAPSTTASPAR